MPNYHRWERETVNERVRIRAQAWILCDDIWGKYTVLTIFYLETTLIAMHLISEHILRVMCLSYVDITNEYEQLSAVNELEWSKNAMRLSEYFVVNAQFDFSAQCLTAADIMLKQLAADATLAGEIIELICWHIRTSAVYATATLTVPYCNRVAARAGRYYDSSVIVIALVDCHARGSFTCDGCTHAQSRANNHLQHLIYPQYECQCAYCYI